MKNNQPRIRGRGLIAILAAMATWTEQPVASAAENFAITEIEPSPDNGISIRFPSDLTTYYTLTRATTLEQFMSAVAMQRGTANEGLFIQSAGSLANPSAFFRVVRNNLASPGDADGDGLDDVFELDHQPGMDPLVAAGPEDSDFDGLSDWTESRYRSDPFAREWLAPIAAGADFSLGIQSDGSMFGWGGNVGGQLGLGTWSLPVPWVSSDY